MGNFMKSVVSKPITVLMSVLIVVALGIFGLTQMQRNLMPEMEIPYITVVTTYVGADPYEVESEVTIPIETKVKQVSGFDTITSTSSENYSMVLIGFNASANMDKALIELSELVSDIDFKEGVGKPTKFQFDLGMLPVVEVALSKSGNVIEDTTWIETDIKDQLTTIEGVADISLSGESNNIVQINFDETKLANYAITSEEVKNIIDEQLFQGEAGMQLNEDNELIIVKPYGKIYNSIEDFENISVSYDSTNSKVIKLSDLINDENGVEILNNNTNVYNIVNGKESITVSFTKTSGYDTIQASENVMAKLDLLKAEHEGMNYTTLTNQAEYINTSIGSVFESLLVGGILAVIILFAFLKDLRPTGVVALSIPASVIGTFGLMWFSGINLNVISMSALVIGIGMLVDNSVVVIENIYRMIRQGLSKTEAAIQGSKQVAGAITASTLTTIAVFLPVLLVDNIMVDMMRDLILTIVYSILASLIIALTLVPTLSSKTFKEGHEVSGGVVKFLRTRYEVALKFTLKYRWSSLIVTFVLFMASMMFGTIHGVQMMPNTYEGLVGITVEMEKGTTFEQTTLYLGEIDRLIREEFDIDGEDARYITANIGNSGSMMSSGFVDTTRGSITIDFDMTSEVSDEIETIEELINNIEFDKLDGLNENNIKEFSVTESATMGGGSMTTGDGISIKLSGQDDQVLRNLSDELIEELKKVDGLDLNSISNGITESGEEVVIDVDQDEAIKNGLTSKNIYESYTIFNELFYGKFLIEGSEKSTIVIGGIDYEITLPTGVDFTNIQDKINDENFDPSKADFGIGITNIQEKAIFQMFVYMMKDPIDAVSIIPAFDRTTIDLINNNKENYIASYDNVNNQINIIDMSNLSSALLPIESIGNVSELTLQGRTANITRDGYNRYINVTAEFDGTVQEQTIQSDVEEILADFNEPVGYSVEFGGALMDFQSLMGDLMIAMTVAIILVYLIMVIQFQNFVYPFIVLFTIPLAMTGGMFAMIITFQKFDMMAMVGLIILVGVVVNTGIVLIDYINKLRRDGDLNLYDSLIEAGKVRMRPILMTSLTTIFGLSVMALGMSAGTAYMKTMAIAAIGGLLYSTILSLIIVPVVYSLINDFKGKLRKEQLK